MTDYFAALAVRTVQPERGVQPRRKTVFDPSIDVTREDRWSLGAPAGSPPATRPSENPTSPPPLVHNPPLARRNVTSEFSDRAWPGDAGHTTAWPVPEGDAAPIGTLADQHDPASFKPAAHVDSSFGPIVAPAASTVAPASTPRSRSPVAPRLTPLFTQREGTPAVRHNTEGGAAGEARTVRIHIGRVDVRAVLETPAPAPPAREARRGLMSLDDYAQQRKGDRS
ncbi:MAG TPA: hypothetical protein VM032_19020 [Vicinamibacterales bacterium]|nr:hypothetical protein [Vicinamibacterales bacterium]